MGLLSWWNRRRVRVDLDEADFQDEIRAHLAIAAQEHVEDGLDPEAARYAALRELGNLTRVTEETRRAWTPRWLETLRDHVSDVRYAVRALARTPVFSLTVVGVLTMGIGLNATVFTMLKGMLFSPLSGVEGSSRLVTVYAETATGRSSRLSYPDFAYLREHGRAFTDLFGSAVARVNLGRGRSARQVWGELVTGNYFQALGVQAQLGRTLLPSDETAPGRHPIVVISDSLWRHDYGADPGIVGTTIELNNVPLTVVGVAAPRFFGTTVVYDVAVFVPVLTAPELGFTFGTQYTKAADILAARQATFFFAMGYLRPGTSLRAGAAETDALWAAHERSRPAAQTPARVRVVPFSQTPGGAPEYILPTLAVLSAMALLVLLIVCANVAGLVTVRGVSRRGELALRQALGASRPRIVRLLVVENVVLALPGAVLGVLFARWAIPFFIGYSERLAAPDRLFFNIEIDGLVIAFAVAVACASALVFGLVPALRTSRVELGTVINQDASPRGAARGRLRSALVVAQVAVSLLLLVGAGLVTRSLEAARRAYPGFDAAATATVGVDVTQNGYDDARGRVFYRKLLEAARADAAVESATLAAYTPLGMTDTRVTRVTIEGHQPPRGDELAFMSNVVAADYFRMLRIPVLSGRGFDDRDDERGAPVIVVNQTLAQRFWGGPPHALGKRIRVADGPWRTVIGVAADVKYSRVNESPRPYFYLPFMQAYRPGMILHVRSDSTPIDVLVGRSRQYVRALDGELPIMYARPMADQLRGALIFFNLAASMLFLFGTAGMILAAMGTYGLVSYTVRQSTHEIGIRVALGASRAAVICQFLSRGLRLGAAGAALGVVVALGATRLLGSVLFGVSATDALSFARALAIVIVGVFLATLVPAWRAARTNPLTALRHQ